MILLIVAMVMCVDVVSSPDPADGIGDGRSMRVVQKELRSCACSMIARALVVASPCRVRPRTQPGQGDHVRAAVDRGRSGDHAAMGAHHRPAREGSAASRSSTATATDYRGTIEALKFKKAEIGRLGPSPTSRPRQRLRQRRADRPDPAGQRLAGLPLVPHRAHRLGRLQPRGQAGRLRLQRPELDLGLPGPLLRSS